MWKWSLPSHWYVWRPYEPMRHDCNTTQVLWTLFWHFGHAITDLFYDVHVNRTTTFWVRTFQENFPTLSFDARQSFDFDQSFHELYEINCVNGNWKSTRYHDEILQSHFIPSWTAVSRHFSARQRQTALHASGVDLSGATGCRCAALAGYLSDISPMKLNAVLFYVDHR